MKKQLIRNKNNKIKPNQHCPCGRGNLKYKKCCGRIKEELRTEAFLREKNKDG